jgi:polysaccharide pyruvyl transferase WcaK-like protein
VFVSGGGQLDDLYGGGWGHPYVLFKWALLARALDVDFVFLSVGAGTLGSPLSRFFARHALSMASYRSYRDATTKGMLVSLGVGANDPIVPDLAYSYPRPNPPVPRRHRAGSPAVVGLSPMVYSHPKIWPRRDPTRYERYLGQLRSFLIWLLQQGHQVVLFASDAQDELAIQDLKARLGQGEWPGTCTHRKVESVASLFELLESCDAVVASRLHGVLLAHLAERPTLAISYEFKVSRLMEDMGLKDYCLEIDEFTSADAVERFQALEANADAVVRAIRQATAPYAARLEVQYQEVFSAIRRRRAKRQPALGAAS